MEIKKETIAIVVGKRGASICGQINKVATAKFGKDRGYMAIKTKNLKDDISLWKISPTPPKTLNTNYGEEENNI